MIDIRAVFVDKDKNMMFICLSSTLLSDVCGGDLWRRNFEEQKSMQKGYG